MLDDRRFKSESLFESDFLVKDKQQLPFRVERSLSYMPKQATMRTVGLLAAVGALTYWSLSSIAFPSTQSKLASTLVASPSMSSKAWTTFDNIFAFGDSYTSYDSIERMEDPPYALKPLWEGDRFRRKPNWITFLTEVYNQSVVQAVDFAEGGSTVDRDIIPPFALGSSLKNEIQEFLSAYSKPAPAISWNPEHTLFIFWFGVNDITMTHVRSKPEYAEFDRPPLPQVFQSYSTSINKIYDAGARNFLFMAAPPFDRSLAMGADDWSARRQQTTITDITSFNARLYDMVADFRRNHSDLTAHLFDTHRFYSRLLDDPQHFAGSASITNPVGICREALPADQPGPLDIVYEQNVCTDGALIQSYAWTALHATYPVHNATGFQVLDDCFTGGVVKGYCS